MRSCRQFAALVWALPTVLSARPALAQEAAPQADAEAAVKVGERAEAEVRDEDVKVTLPPKGYIPGSRRVLSLGSSPHAPRSPATAGTMIPWSAPEQEDGGFQFNFGGYMSAAARLSSNSRGSRSKPTVDQFSSTLHGLPQTVDVYGAVQGTNAPPGSWVELRFDYGNSIVKSVVKLSTWKPSRGQSWIETSSQNWVNEAFLVFTMPPAGDLSLSWTVGAFRNTYGGLGQYGVGQYNAPIIGAPFGVGETLTAQYALSDTLSLILEHGIMGRTGKVAIGEGPNAYDHEPSPSDPSAFTHHAHVGFSLAGEVPLQGGLHYLHNWAQDERDQVDDPKSPFLDEGNRPDPRLTVLGADFRMIDNHLGNGAIAVSYADAKYAALLSGMNYFGSDSGEMLTKRLLGQRPKRPGEQGGGNGKILVVGAEYNFSWGKFLWYPDAFWGDGPDLINSVFANVIKVTSDDPEFDGRFIYKVGTEATYRVLPWFAVSARYDHVQPNSKDEKETFDVISPKLIFRSNWNSHEQVVLSYTRWFLGEHTHGEAPNDYFQPYELDDQMFALNFGMWW
jgi:hypothetical protein